MNPLQAFLLIDSKEIFIKIYQEVETNNWQSLYEKNFAFDKRKDDVNETVRVVEVIASIFSNIKGLGIEEWRIYSRNMERQTINEIAKAINIKVIVLSPQKEKTLLLNAILAESLRLTNLL